MDRAITVFTTVDGRPCNKIVSRAPDGSIIKQRAKSGRYVARTVLVPTMAALADVLRDVGARHDQMVSLSLFVDPPVDEWQVWACWDLAEAVGCDKNDRETLKGFHLVNGAWVAARIKESMRLGPFLLFDRDMSEGMPEILAELDVAGWRAAVALPFPGADECGCVILPSTSNRILVDGVRSTSKSCHMIVEVGEPALIEAKWDQACHRCLITSFAPAPWEDDVCLAFAKPVYDRKGGTGEVLRYSWWTIFDRSTWSVGREVFDGAPFAAGAGVEILPPEVEHHDGPPLNLFAVRDLTKPELAMVAEVVREITGFKPHISADRSPGRDGKLRVSGLGITIPDLDLDLDVELEDGSWTTVRAIMGSGAAHVRLQSPFRESTSMAAFYGVHDDGTPFVFDMGTREKHILARVGLKHIWQHISEWLEEEYRPAFRGVDGSMFSEEHGRRVTMRDVHPAPDVLTRLRMASNTPVNAGGGVKENALPTEFNKWLPFAWTDRLSGLPFEDEAKINDAAGEEFKMLLVRLLKAHVQHDSGGRWLKRALGTWCHYQATLMPGEWRQVGTYDAWGRILADGAFQIAITHHLAGQVSRTNHPVLANLDHQALSKLCRKYGILANVGDNRIKTAGVRQMRVTILTPEFVLSSDLSYDHDDPQAAAMRAGLNADPSLRSKEGSGPMTH